MLPLPYTNHNINMLNACNAKHNSEAQLKFDSAQLLQHVPQTRPYPARKLYKVFKCKLFIHHPHLASSNLDAKVFSANSKIFTSCNCSFAIAHALMKQVGLGKPAILFDKKKPIPAKIPPHGKLMPLRSAAVFDQVLIETCSNSCEWWTEGSRDPKAMIQLKSVSYYSIVIVIFNGYVIC